MITLIVPIKTISESNNREHWRAKWSRAKKQKAYVAIAWRAAKLGPIELPCIVTLTRLSPRLLDDDNLRGALKAIRDSVADLLLPGLLPGRADSHMEWRYGQEKVNKINMGVRVEIFDKPA